MEDVGYAAGALDEALAGKEGSSERAVRPSYGRPGCDALDWRGVLARVVSSEIVPRLMTMQQDCGAARKPWCGGPSDPSIPEFTRCLLAQDSAVAQAFIEALRRKSASVEMILLEVLAPAARQLGDLWTRDECDFVQVSVGLHRLQGFMDDMCSDLERAGPVETHSVLLLAAPGETHEFGVAMVGNFFRADGWRVAASSPASVLQHLHVRPYHIVGFSLSCAKYLENLRELVSRSRRVSRNRSIRVLVGGPVFLEKAELAREVGADGTAADAQGAVHLARSLLEGRRGSVNQNAQA